MNPREAWVITQVPDLAIITDDLWTAAQARLAAGRRTVCAPDPGSAEEESEAVPNLGARLAAARRPVWALAGLVRCGCCSGPMTVMGSGGRLGCANHVERGTCGNRRTLLRDKVLTRALARLKERLLAPELVEEFVRTYVAEVNAANRERGARQAGLAQQQAKLARQIRNLLELIKKGHGSAAMVGELKELEARQAALAREIAAGGTPEPVPVLHPNLPELYRRRVEALEQALADPVMAAAAAEALRELIDAILVLPGERRGETTIQLRGDLATFLHLGHTPAGGAGGSGAAAHSKSAVLRVGNGRSGRMGEVLGSLDAGTGFEPVTFRL